MDKILIILQIAGRTTKRKHPRLNPKPLSVPKSTKKGLTKINF